MTEIILKFVLIALGPMAIHFTAMLGSFLITPVKTGQKRFDAVYNKNPWLFSLLAGLFAFFGYLVLSLWPLVAFAFIALAFLSFVGDLVGIGNSVFNYFRGDGSR